MLTRTAISVGTMAVCIGWKSTILSLRAIIQTLIFEPTNLVVLCRDCHMQQDHTPDAEPLSAGRQAWADLLAERLAQ